jgi:S1-C subfamily serine protease
VSKNLIAVLLIVASFGLASLAFAPVADNVYPIKIIKVAQVPTFPTIQPRVLKRAVGIEHNGSLVGSGVIIETGRVLSAAHVFQAPDGDLSKYTVRLGVGAEGHTVASQIKMIQLDTHRDLALLSCFTSPFSKIHLAEGSIPVGAPVVTVGSPTGVQHDLLSPLGFLSSKRDSSGGGFPGCWIVSASSFFGNSGGGAFEANSGYLVGIVSGGSGAGGVGMAPNLIYVVSAVTVRDFLKGK